MAHIQLYTENKIVTLFFCLPEDMNLKIFKESIEDVEYLNIDPSFIHFACVNGWEDMNDSLCYSIQFDIDTFKDLFLSEESVEGVHIKYPRQNTPGNHNSIYFQLSNETLTKFINHINEENTKEITNDMIKNEFEFYSKEKSSNSYKLNYTFPISFLSDKVKDKLNLKTKNKKNSLSPESKKVRLTPAHKIYDRVLHDPTIDENLFSIGYLDRFVGIKEVLFTRFVTLDSEKFYNTSVPFHRVRYFKYLTHVVWDRDTRVNLIDGNHFLSLE